VFSFQPVLAPVSRPLVSNYTKNVGQAINAVTGTRRLGFVFSFVAMFFQLSTAASDA
jgi:hypothetical protein